jgi:hypothetical protein
VSFVIFLLSRNESTIEKVRWLPFLCIGMLISGTIALCSVHAWLVVGNGNANFVFFPSLVFSACFAITIIEYARAAKLTVCGEIIHTSAADS